MNVAEATLGLPHGFFDQPHPALTPETISRLKAPLDFVQTDDEAQAESEVRKPALAVNVDQPPSVEVSSLEEAEMPGKTVSGLPGASRNRAPEIAVHPRKGAALKGASSKARASQKTAQQHSLPLSDGTDVESIRRANLYVLTTRNGSKVKLGVVMAMSGSNMAHRLHGKKRMDDAEASRFTERLGLPVGWLDTPRSEAEIPESVSDLLTPAARGRASVQHDEPAALAAQSSAPRKRAAARARTEAPHPHTLGDVQSVTGSVNVPSKKEIIDVGPRDHASDALGEFGGYSIDESERHFPSVSPTTIALQPASTLPRQTAVPLPSTSVTSLDNLHGIEPVAEALIKTLAAKHARVDWTS
ncbi:hypothetical protein CBA19CS11_37365 [Caballeronia novacaledonica]|uniref:hypothetical protein n=1 Tax=Caballeronia novacaledonica TaxID=1544861 RepID=UPI001EE35463|nr:hypothetical protein [Caballeronia novacaledonica]GJH14633.1 hypothetical protein CBA19CS11_37365 [Caballeronia novacaledonica]